jgi:hypothetical protein
VETVASAVTAIATGRRPVWCAASAPAFPSTIVSARSAYMLQETIVAGSALSGFRSFSATTEPVSIGKPW